MIRNILVFWFIFVLFLSVPVSGYADGPGSNSGEVLRMSLGGYAPAMGNAFTAYAAGAASMQYNPGGLAFSARTEGEMMYQKMVEGISQGNFAVAAPLHQGPDFGHSLGLDVKFIDYGSFNRTELGSGAGVSLNQNGTFSARDMATGLGYGMRFNNYAIGITGRYLSLRIDDVKATGMSTDIGLQWRHPDQFLRAGLVLKNLGTDIQFDERKETIPTALRGGISATLFRRARLNIDLEYVKNDGMYFNGGLEYVLLGYFPIRAGYDGRSDLDGGLTFGTGFKYDSMYFDYAYTPFGEFGNNHLFGLRYRF